MKISTHTSIVQRTRQHLRALLVLGVLAAAGSPAQAQVQEYGVFTERPSVTNRLVYGPTVNLYKWNNLADITSPTPVPYEGQQVWAVRAANGADWFGMGLDHPVLNMSAYAGGTLRFFLKTSSPGLIKFGLKSGAAESWITFPAGSTQYGVVRDGSWHQVNIPISAFQQQLPTLNLAGMTGLFMFAGDPAGASADFFMDDIYYTTATVTASAVAKALDATLAVAPSPSQDRAQLTFTPVQATAYEAALYDLKGARVAIIGAGTAATSQRVSLPVESSKLANGIYLVKLTTGQDVLTRRLVVSH